MTTAAQTLHRYTLSSLHALRWLRHSVVAVCLWIWSTALYLAKHKGTKLEHIQRDIKQLKKLPVHIALLVNEREVSCSDLARLVNWCFCVGIHYVSLYDPRGRLHIHSTGCGFTLLTVWLFSCGDAMYIYVHVASSTSSASHVLYMYNTIHCA